jgi:ubiquinone/menaquinone biosynthesis C-methylase UbiE
MTGTNNHSADKARWQRFWNAVLYDTLAPVYDSLDWLTLGEWWRLVRRALDYVPSGGRVLEVGFGPGRLHVELARRAEVCVGLDLAWGMCRFTRRRLTRAGLVSRVTRGSAFALPYPAETFDAAVSTFAISGLPHAGDALAEMARVTRRGGCLVLVDIGLPLDGNRAGTFWARLWERMGDYLYDFPVLMADAGLRVSAFEEFGPGHHIRVIVGER